MSRKGIRSTLKYIGWGIIGFLAFLLLWGLIEPYLVDTEAREATIPSLPAVWEGKQIGQVSDFQIGMWMDNVSTVRRSIETLVEASPAAALISGDFIYHALDNPDVEISKAVELVRPLTEAGIPTYAVLGNHDYSNTPPIEALADQVETALEAIGVVVLQNEAVPLPLPASTQNPGLSGDRELYLVGIGSHIAQNDNVEAALAAVPDNQPRIVMMHNPASFAKFPAQTAPFAIAGHTHGGQIRLPNTPDWSLLSLMEPGEVHADGWIDDYGEPGNQLYVNRGIGFSIVPIRINCKPEVTLFTLRSPQV